MTELRIPTIVAVTAWVASAMAVASYTWIAFKETATDLEGAGMAVGAATNPLVASTDVLSAEVAGKPQKPLDRERFKPSR